MLLLIHVIKQLPNLVAMTQLTTSNKRIRQWACTKEFSSCFDTVHLETNNFVFYWLLFKENILLHITISQNEFHEPVIRLSTVVCIIYGDLNSMIHFIAAFSRNFKA